MLAQPVIGEHAENSHFVGSAALGPLKMLHSLSNGRFGEAATRHLVDR